MLTGFKIFLVESENYKFSSVLAIFPTDITKKIINWGKKNIKESNLDEKEGREQHPHITVLYGFHTENPKEIINFFKKQKSFTCKLGKISLFKNEKHDVVKIEIICPELHKINKLLKKNFKHTDKYDKYIPHATIAYVKKDKANKFIDNEDFKDIEFIINKLVFSSKSGEKTPINLGD